MGQTYIPSSVPATFAPSPTPAVVSSGLNDLFELSSGIGMAPGGYVAPKSVRKGKEQPQYVAIPWATGTETAHMSPLLLVSGAVGASLFNSFALCLP